MENVQDTKLKQLHNRLSNVAHSLAKTPFSHFCAETWSPAVNAYRCKECIAVCLDLAGVEQSLIRLQVESRRLLIRGRREAPEPNNSRNPAMHVLTMEIDYGSFEREVALPSEVEKDQIVTEQQNGLLWIYLPLRSHA